MTTRTRSAFLEKGVVTPEEFVLAGDFLVAQCPTWSWQGGDPASAKPYLPSEKQFLVTRNVPCRERAAAMEAFAGAERHLDGEEEGWVETGGGGGRRRERRRRRGDRGHRRRRHGFGAMAADEGEEKKEPEHGGRRPTRLRGHPRHGRFRRSRRGGAPGGGRRVRGVRGRRRGCRTERFGRGRVGGEDSHDAHVRSEHHVRQVLPDPARVAQRVRRAPRPARPQENARGYLRGAREEDGDDRPAPAHARAVREHPRASTRP